MHAFANRLIRTQRTSILKRDCRTVPNVQSVAYATDKAERNGNLSRYIADRAVGARGTLSLRIGEAG